MKCKNCDKEMELEEISEDCLGDEVICIRRDFWCACCNATAIVNTWYYKHNEECEWKWSVEND
jgi:hypothetical protein